ncbi:HNH endonuclease [Bradyrhizobium sp. RDM12]
MSEKIQHFAAYHNIAGQGGRLQRGRGGYWGTNKPQLPRPGDVLWCFEGEGYPRRYRLVKRAVATRSQRQLESSKVHYSTSIPVEADTTNFTWFQELLKEQRSFSFGLNAIRDRDIIAELERLAAGAEVKRRAAELFSVAYRNPTAEGWVDFYPVSLFASKKSGSVLYRCQHYGQRYIARATLNFGEDYVDVITDNQEAARLDIYPGTVRFFLGESAGSMTIAEVRWADPGKKFVHLEPAPAVDLVTADDVERRREIDRLERIAKHRPEQVRFRSELFSIYNGACAVTGCTIPEALQAAHLETLDGKDINDPCNGILLRADIHELFDAGLLSLSRDGLNIEISELLTDDYYLGFQGRPVFRPPSFAPSEAHIDAHRRASGFSVSPPTRRRRIA